MSYQFATLAPFAAAQKNPKLAETNEKVFAAGVVYGIEVTDANAQRCVFNLDPQHDGSGSSLAAIEAALMVELPAEGATLATIRADLDSFGSMAVFQLRLEGHSFTEGQMARIQLIATADKARNDIWVPRDLTVEGIQRSFTEAPLSAIASAVSVFTIPVPSRVTFVREFILTGTEPAGYRESYEKAQLDNALAYESGEILVETRGKVVLVVSTHRAATSVGYAHAPVVIALNPEFQGNDGSLAPHAKYTVCQFSVGHADIPAIGKELTSLEPGWGGSTVLVGSPQGVASILSIEQIYEVVKKHVK